MVDIFMKIKRSEYLEMKRALTVLEKENETLTKEIEVLTKANETLKKNATKNISKTDIKKKEAI